MEGYIGEIRLFGGNFNPRAWALCQGQLLAISSNTALFSIIGTIYGGDGRTTFALPDLRGRTAIGSGNGPGLPSYQQGQRSGTETNHMTVGQMPSHTHSTSINVSTEDAEETAPTGVLGKATIYNEDPTANAHLGGVASGMTGNNQAINNMQPYIVPNFIICLQGIYPSRS